MTYIEVDGLTKRFGDTVALDDVSFEVPAGEFVIVLGVSGSGKSTLLRTLSGLLSPTDGEILIDGEPMFEPRPEVAMIFQQHNIIGDMTAYSNSLSGGVHRSGFLSSVLQLQDPEEKHRALDALDTVGLLRRARTEGAKYERRSTAAGGDLPCARPAAERLARRRAGREPRPRQRTERDELPPDRLQ